MFEISYPATVADRKSTKIKVSKIVAGGITVLLTAYLTAERRVIGVRAHMISEMLFARVLLAAHLAVMRCLTGVPHNVVHEVFLASEALLAYVATVRCLARVFAHVIYHVFFARERLRAVLTPTMIKEKTAIKKLSVNQYYLIK